MVKSYFEDLKNLFDNFDLNTFKKLEKEILKTISNESKILIFGNGGSGSTASHFAVDFNKCACEGFPVRFRVICLNDNIPSILAYANDDCYENIFKEQVITYASKNDLIIGISGSGNSENVVRALEYTKLIRLTTASLSGFDGGKVSNITDIPLVIRFNEMQKVEDMHMIIVHMLMKSVRNSLVRKYE